MRNPVFFLALWEGVKPKILLPKIFFQHQNRKMKSAQCGLIKLQSAPWKLTNHFSILILTDLIRWQTSFSVIWESKYWFKAIHYLTFVIRNVCISHNSTGIFYSFWIRFIWNWLEWMFWLIWLVVGREGNLSIERMSLLEMVSASQGCADWFLLQRIMPQYFISVEVDWCDKL